MVADLEALKGLKTGTQKTVRWPGYAAKVTALREMGLLSEKPIDVDGAQVAPKKVSMRFSIRTSGWRKASAISPSSGWKSSARRTAGRGATRSTWWIVTMR